MRYDLSDKNKWELVSFENFLTPKDGYVCVCNRYWWITESGELLFYKCNGYYSMQCNHNLNIMQPVPDGCRIEFFEVLYLSEKYYGGER